MKKGKTTKSIDMKKGKTLKDNYTLKLVLLFSYYSSYIIKIVNDKYGMKIKSAM